MLPDENWIVAFHSRSERPKLRSGFRERVEKRHRAGEPRGRTLGGGQGELGQLVGREDAHGLGRLDLLAELEDVLGLGTESDRHRHRYGHDACILTAEEGGAEAGPGIGHEDQPLAWLEAGPDQPAGEGLGFLAELPVGQWAKQTPAGVEEVKSPSRPGRHSPAPRTGCRSRRGERAGRRCGLA